MAWRLTLTRSVEYQLKPEFQNIITKTHRTTFENPEEEWLFFFKYDFISYNIKRLNIIPDTN